MLKISIFSICLALLVSSNHLGITLAKQKSALRRNIEVRSPAQENKKEGPSTEDNDALLDGFDDIFGNGTKDLLGDIFGNDTGSVLDDIFGNNTGSILDDIFGDDTGSILEDIFGNDTDRLFNTSFGNGTDDFFDGIFDNITDASLGKLTGDFFDMIIGNLTGNFLNESFFNYTTFGDMMGSFLGDLNISDIIGDTFLQNATALMSTAGFVGEWLEDASFDDTVCKEKSENTTGCISVFGTEGLWVCRTLTNPFTGVESSKSVCVSEGQYLADNDDCGCCIPEGSTKPVCPNEE